MCLDAQPDQELRDKQAVVAEHPYPGVGKVTFLAVC